MLGPKIKRSKAVSFRMTLGNRIFIRINATTYDVDYIMWIFNDDDEKIVFAQGIQQNVFENESNMLVSILDFLGSKITMNNSEKTEYKNLMKELLEDYLKS